MCAMLSDKLSHDLSWGAVVSTQILPKLGVIAAFLITWFLSNKVTQTSHGKWYLSVFHLQHAQHKLSKVRNVNGLHHI